jgi:hypothetical protein
MKKLLSFLKCVFLFWKKDKRQKKDDDASIYPMF